MQETQLYNAWIYYARIGRVITWRKNRLKILHPGELNEQYGPDFKGCRFKLNDVVYQGAVEMHINNSDWYSHQHHYNPLYRDVLLHIIAEDPGKQSFVTHRLNAHPVPSFVLSLPVRTQNATRCVKSLTPINSQERLEYLALERLYLKCFAYQKALQTFNINQIFYNTFFRILGYPVNKLIFEMLAQRVTQGVVDNVFPDKSILLALYLGSAGFLNDSFHDPYARRLQRTFLNINKYLNFNHITKSLWQMSAVKPLNHPHFRLAGWVALLLKEGSFFVFQKIYNLLCARFDYQKIYNELSSFFRIPVDGYWAENYALQKKAGKGHPGYYFGAERIREIIVNLILPLSLAQAQIESNPGLEAYLNELFLNLPGNSMYGSLAKQLPWHSEYLREGKKAYYSQAFLNLAEQYCLLRKCSVCPLNRIPDCSD